MYEYRGSIQACRGGVTKPKYIWSWMWQQMWKVTRRASRDTSAVKGRLGKMGTYCWVGQGTGWQRAGERPGYLMSSWSLLVRLGIRESKAPEASGKVLSNENLLSVKEDQNREHLNKPNKSVGHDAVHHWPTWLGGHSQFFERLLAVRGGSRGLEEGKIHFCLQEWQEAGSGKLQASQTHLMSEKVVEQIILESVFKYMKDKEVIGRSQQRFMKSSY